MGAFMTTVIIASIYLAPTMLALHRKARLRGSVAAVNIFLGWTFIGWVVALAIAAGSESEE